MHRHLFILIIFGFFQIKGAVSQSVASLEKEKLSIQKNLEKSSSLLKKYSKQKSNTYSRIRLLDNQIASRVRLLDIYNKEIDWLNEDISALEKDITSSNRELSKLKSDYAQLIQKSYRNRQVYNEFSFFLGAASFNDAYRRFVIIKEYNKFRKNQGLLIVKETQKLAEKKGILETKLVVQQNALDKVVKEKQSLEQNKRQLSSSIKGLQRKESQIKSDISKQKKALKKLEDAIIKIINDSKESEPIFSEFNLAIGKLSWPVKSGVIVSKFGEHQHPVLKYVKVNNNGVDIQSTVTNQSLVVFDGIVSRVVTIPGYNKTVIIRHGKYLTVYANLTSVEVKKGDAVKKGQLLGLIYKGDGDNSEVLHFEIWKENVKLNPEKWLSN